MRVALRKYGDDIAFRELVGQSSDVNVRRVLILSEGESGGWGQPVNLLQVRGAFQCAPDHAMMLRSRMLARER